MYRVLKEQLVDKDFKELKALEDHKETEDLKVLQERLELQVLVV